jgi:hypothetical protein
MFLFLSKNFKLWFVASVCLRNAVDRIISIGICIKKSILITSTLFVATTCLAQNTLIADLPNGVKLQDRPWSLIRKTENFNHLAPSFVAPSVVNWIDQKQRCTIRGWLKNEADEKKLLFINWVELAGQVTVVGGSVGVFAFGGNLAGMKHDSSEVGILGLYGRESFPKFSKREIKLEKRRITLWVRNLDLSTNYYPRFQLQLRVFKKSEPKACAPIHPENICQIHEAEAEIYGYDAGAAAASQVYVDLGQIVIRDECVSKGLYPVSRFWQGYGGSATVWESWQYQKPFYDASTFILFPKF